MKLLSFLLHLHRPLVAALCLIPSGLLLRARSLTAAIDAKSKHSTGDSLWGEFTVSYRYPVEFTEGVFDPANTCLYRQLTASRQRNTETKVLIFVDAQLLARNPELGGRIQRYFAHHDKTLRLLAPPGPVAAGEEGKRAQVLQQLYEEMLRRRLDRHCYVLAIGGGALLDVVGYACATFHRGIRLIRLPTTVLAQNDAGVGVKNGINAFAQKNLLGAFYPPAGVINDFEFLLSLEPRDQIAGLAEAVKVAVIKDADFFCWLEQHADALAAFDPAASRSAIHRCARLHLAQITAGGDPFERGNGRPLDYGHWAAHRLENLSRHRLRHGEAVAAGMALDALYAAQIGLLPRNGAARLLQLLTRLGFCLSPPELALQDASGRVLVLQGLEEFRQHLGGELSIPMLCGIGQALDVDRIDPAAMARALHELQEYGVGPNPTAAAVCAS